jgi:hypothetical protein
LAVVLSATAPQDLRQCFRELGTRHHLGSSGLACRFQEVFFNVWGKGNQVDIRELVANPLDYLDSLVTPETEIHHKTGTWILTNHFVEFGLRSSDSKVNVKVSGSLHDLRLEEKIRYASYDRH